MHLNVHSITYGTLTNGPGKRNMIHLQGCSLKCAGCFSPHTWSSKENTLLSIEDVLTELLRDDPDGITISGGEPMQQSDAVLALLQSIRSHVTEHVANISILMYTGYTLIELTDHKVYDKLSVLLDVLISGRYVASDYLGRDLRGSANQKITLFSNRHSEEELLGNDNIVEVLIDSQGIRVTGFPTKEVLRTLIDSLEG